MRHFSGGTRLLAVAVCATPFLVGAAIRSPATDVPLATLDLTKMRVQPAGGRGGAAQTVAQANKSIDGEPIRIAGKEFADGRRDARDQRAVRQLAGGAEQFSAMVGADDNPPPVPPAAAGQPARRRRLPRRSSFASSATAACFT